MVKIFISFAEQMHHDSAGSQQVGSDSSTGGDFFFPWLNAEIILVSIQYILTWQSIIFTAINKADSLIFLADSWTKTSKGQRGRGTAH